MIVFRRYNRRLLTLFIAILIVLHMFYLSLPPDSHLLLSIKFNSSRFLNHLRHSITNRDAWLSSNPAPFPLCLPTDVGFLIKTGYGTRYRVPAQLDAFAQEGGILGEEGNNFLVVGDWTTVDKTEATLLGVHVQDVIKMVMEARIDESLRNHTRFVKYKTLQEAVASGNEDEATKLGESFGWELDALKFIIGMELTYKVMPQKKWYVILDDDSFLVRSSLHKFLSHLDPSRPYYIGNAVGDYKTRFAHGGSVAILSGKAMRRLFNRADIIDNAYTNSLDETWGDRLVATTLMKVGIYLDERYSHHFNGEIPKMTRISSDRFCSLILSFHGLRQPGAMKEVGHVLAKLDKPLIWGDLWRLFAKNSTQTTGEQPMLQTSDHVGRRDGNTETWEMVKSAEACRHKCSANGCLAWTYDRAALQCHFAPWAIVGDNNEERESGLGPLMLQLLSQQCN